MKYLHTMVRVSDLEASLAFYTLLGLREIRRYDHEAGRFTLIFLAAPGDEEAQVELTFNWDPEVYTGGRNFGHLAYEVDDIYADCQRMMDGGALLQTLTRFPRLGSCTVKVSCDERFQRTAFYRRGHPMGGALVLSIRHQLP